MHNLTWSKIFAGVNSALFRICAGGYYLGAPLAFRLYLWLHPGKYGEKTTEKLGRVPLRDLSKPCLLIHAVSVGETLAARTIIDEFHAVYPDWRIMVSTSTATGRQVAEDKYGAANVVYYPLDCSWWVNRFLRNLRPQMIVLMELEIWPAFMAAAKEYNIPVVVANARITAESAAQYNAINRWMFLRPGVKTAFNTPARWLAQTEEYAERLRTIGVEADKVRINGNIKFDQIPTAMRTGEGAVCRAEIGGSGPLLVAGSTHPGEDEAVLTAWNGLRAEFSELKLVIAPRHPHRIKDVLTLAKKYGTVKLRSVMQKAAADKMPALETDIVIIDTMGELAKFYAAADVVFVGGTLIPHGGQNMAEPCGLAKPTIIGDSYHNFTETVAALQAEGAITIIHAAAELAPALCVFLQDTARAAAIGEKARTTLLQHAGASRRTVEILGEVYGSVSGI